MKDQVKIEAKSLTGNEKSPQNTSLPKPPGNGNRIPRNENQQEDSLTPKDVGSALLVYLVIPIIFLIATSTYHEFLLHQKQDHSDFQLDSSGWNWYIQQALTSHVLLLGFRSKKAMWRSVYERLVSVTCWGFCFLFVRKGCNPSLRRKGFLHLWKGVVLSSLSVLYSSVTQSFIQQIEVYLLGWSQRFVVLDAVWVGITWALANLLIRRRLDPKARKELFGRRTFRDILYGSLSFAVSSFIKSTVGPMILLPWIVWCERILPVEKSRAVVYLWSTLFGKPPTIFWSTLCRALFVGFMYTVTFLGIRRYANPDTRRKCIQRYGMDGVLGGVALVVHAYLKLAVFRWLPILIQLIASCIHVVSPIFEKETTTTETGMDVDMDGEL